MTTLAVWTLFQEGARFDATGTVLRVGACIAAYAVVTLVQRVLSSRHVFSRVRVQLNLLALAALLLFFLRPVLAGMAPAVMNGVLAAAVFLAVSVGLLLGDVVLFDFVALWRKRPQAPLVIRDIGRWILSLIALIVIFRQFFPGVNLNVLAVSSLVVGYVVGNATQDTLGNLIAGLALNAEHPFRIGDWVTVTGHTGAVVDTTWRATRLKTKEEDYIVIPNSMIAKEAIVNYSRPTGIHACRLTVGVSYDSPPNTVREVIMGVLDDAPGVVREPASMVYLSAYSDSAVTFTLKFFIDDYAALDRIQSNVMDRLWYAFRRHGISIPYPIRDVRPRDVRMEEQAKRMMVRDGARQLLAGVDLFATLSAQELDRLVERVKVELFAAGETLCRQGEAGDSFYLIRGGRVAVLVAGPDGKATTVAHLEAGAFFGEMSLLTGDSRSGTVVAVSDVEVVRVGKDDFAGLLAADAELAGKLAVVLETRSAQRKELLAVSASGAVTPDAHSVLVTRIRRFFGL